MKRTECQFVGFVQCVRQTKLAFQFSSVRCSSLLLLCTRSNKGACS